MDGSERVNPDISLHPAVHEVEFWKRYRALLRMTRHLAGGERLIRALQEETAIPEKTRDEAIGPLKEEHAQNFSAFHDFLVNFVSLALQGLHRADISLEFSFTEGVPRCHRALLHVDGHPRDLPVEEGRRLLACLPLTGEDPHPEQSLLRFYEAMEQRFDRDQKGELDRCSLEIRQEIYPGSAFHARLHLPAQVFIEGISR